MNLRKKSLFVLYLSICLTVALMIAGCVRAPAPTPAPITQVPAPTVTPTPAPAPNPTPAPGPARGIRFDRVPDVIGPYGEKVEINLSFTNEASAPRTISPFPPEIKIIELPDVKSPGIVVQAFSVGSVEIALQPGESASHSIDWDQKNDSGEQVPPGWYSVEVTLSTSRGSATRVLVLPPEGVMEKTIEVNQSETVNGITITLERVELTATGMKVYAFNTPPDYNLPQGPMLAPPQFMALHAFAEYGIDGGVMKQAFPSGIRFLENGMLHTWDEYLDPVPKNAKELTFTITKLGDWEGTWEFKVPMESHGGTARVPGEAVVSVRYQLEGGGYDRISGFIISNDGKILTFHPDASEIISWEVVLSDGRSFGASIFKTHEIWGFTCLKIEAPDLTPLQLADYHGLQPPANEADNYELYPYAMREGLVLFASGYDVGQQAEMEVEVLAPYLRLPLNPVRYPERTFPVVKLDTGGEPVMIGVPVVNSPGQVMGQVVAFNHETGECFMVTIDLIKSCLFESYTFGPVIREYPREVVKAVFEEIQSAIIEILHEREQRVLMDVPMQIGYGKDSIVLLFEDEADSEIVEMARAIVDSRIPGLPLTVKGNATLYGPTPPPIP